MSPVNLLWRNGKRRRARFPRRCRPPAEQRRRRANRLRDAFHQWGQRLQGGGNRRHAEISCELRVNRADHQRHRRPAERQLRSRRGRQRWRRRHGCESSWQRRKFGRRWRRQRQRRRQRRLRVEHRVAWQRFRRLAISWFSQQYHHGRRRRRRHHQQRHRRSHERQSCRHQQQRRGWRRHHHRSRRLGCWHRNIHGQRTKRSQTFKTTAPAAAERAAPSNFSLFPADLPARLSAPTVATAAIPG